MANNLAQLPWIIDTAGAGQVGPDLTFLKGVTFFGYTAATDQAIVKDELGRTIISLTGVAGLTPVSWYFQSTPVPVRKLAVTTLTTGKLEVDVTGNKRG